MFKITIQTNADLTPAGKRAARVVPLNRGRAPRIRWYVGGRIYNQLPVTPDNIAMTREWVAC
jgi:hypothetical protein